jgi:hypothetical protein
MRCILIVLLALALAGTAVAAPPHPGTTEVEDMTFLSGRRKAVVRCVAEVREWTKTQNSDQRISTFDAYITGRYDRTVHFIGTPEQKFQFRKCMVEIKAFD